MAENSFVDFMVFDTTYRIFHHKTADLEPPREENTIPIHIWTDLGDFASVDRVQRQLQLLGYYLGKVDNIYGEKTERAVLWFQADLGLRTDGKFNATFLAKLDDIIDNSNKTGGIYVARRMLIRFTRAPLDDPNVLSSRPWGKAPDLDDRGFVKVPTLGSLRSGPVVTMTEAQEFRLKAIRENISDSAELIMDSSDRSKLDIGDPALPKQKKMILNLESKIQGDCTVDIYFKGAGRTKIGSLQATALSLIQLKVQPYLVTIDRVPPSGTKEDWREIFDIANNIWWPYGINFVFAGIIEKTVDDLSVAGQISEVGGVLKPEFDTVVNEIGCQRDAINLVIVSKIQNAIGVSYTTAMFSWPNGIILSMNLSGKNIAAGNDLAHELGHCLSLANINSPTHHPFHADDDPDEEHKKDDMWTLKKLMYSYNTFAARAADAWAQDVGYGTTFRGSMVTIRHLNNDLTDDECNKARTWAQPDNQVYFK